MDSDSELEVKLISLITQLMTLKAPTDWESKFISLIVETISLVRSVDFDSRPKPESELMSLITRTISLFNSLSLDSQPKPLSDLISLITHIMSQEDSKYPVLDFMSLMRQSLRLEQEPEFLSLIRHICSLVIFMRSEYKELISLCPKVQVRLERGTYHVVEEVELTTNNKWACLPTYWEKYTFTGKAAKHFLCRSCNGKNHKEYEEAPIEIKHPLHPQHFLQLALTKDGINGMRECYCCDEYLHELFYYCSACDFAIKITCVEKTPVLSIDHPKWHEHTLAHYPRHAPITCNLCALAELIRSPIYMCPPCNFVVHQSCLNLPRVIKISRHPHRISFISSFDQGDWYCGVCRRKINNDYGGYSCIKKSCSYVAHSKCATQRNVWDGTELEGEPEEIEEEVEPFVRISYGIIQHFSHTHHHLRLEENNDIDYDENKVCQACITPIYFGNLYSCMQCDFNLHEACANFSRKIHHPIHSHKLNLLVINDNVRNDANRCDACPYYCTAGFLYECSKQGCCFRLHVQCANISEPLVHGSHNHPLFLTSKPGESRRCSVCLEHGNTYANETFNCIECECDFALCYKCAALPEKVRYKHDKHILTLSYGEETSTMTTYWCEVCERKIKPKERFYMCDEHCCVTLHIECLVGESLYMKPGSSLYYMCRKVNVLPNNQNISRPICSYCEKRCPHNIVFRSKGSIFCSLTCFRCKNHSNILV